MKIVYYTNLNLNANQMAEKDKEVREKLRLNSTDGLLIISDHSLSPHIEVLYEQ